MTELFVYEYDPVTGYIGHSGSSEYKDDAPILQIQNSVATTEPIKAVVTTTKGGAVVAEQLAAVASGWSFVLDEKGKPTLDENGYIIATPPNNISPPDKFDYIIAALARDGKIDPELHMHPEDVELMNQSFQKAGLPVLAGTAAVDMPEKTAVTASSGIVRKLG